MKAIQRGGARPGRRDAGKDMKKFYHLPSLNP
jgi:hypothetical protein